MKNFELWRKLSNITGYTCLAIAIIRAFFRKYVDDYIVIIMAFGAVMLIVFLFSELMKFLIKNKKF